MVDSSSLIQKPLRTSMATKRLGKAIRWGSSPRVAVCLFIGTPAFGRRWILCATRIILNISGNRGRHLGKSGHKVVWRRLPQATRIDNRTYRFQRELAGILAFANGGRGWRIRIGRTRVRAQPLGSIEAVCHGYAWSHQEFQWDCRGDRKIQTRNCLPSGGPILGATLLQGSSNDVVNERQRHDKHPRSLQIGERIASGGRSHKRQVLRE